MIKYELSLEQVNNLLEKIKSNISGPNDFIHQLKDNPESLYMLIVFRDTLQNINGEAAELLKDWQKLWEKYNVIKGRIDSILELKAFHEK